MSDTVPFVRYVANTAPVMGPRRLPEIPLGHALCDSAYLLHRVFGSDVTHGAQLRYRKPVSHDDYRFAGFDTLYEFRKACVRIRQTDSLVHMTSLLYETILGQAFLGGRSRHYFASGDPPGLLTGMNLSADGLHSIITTALIGVPRWLPSRKSMIVLMPA
jgi:hypothetical protein